MTIDPYAKVATGERLKIHANAWNKLLDTVRPEASLSPGEEFSYARTNFRVHCQNDTGVLVPRWGVLRISDVLLGASAATTGSWIAPGVVGSTPNGPDNPCVIAVEPIGADKIGQAAVAGVVQVQVVVNCATHQYARPKSSQVSYLETADSGPFRLLWRGTTGATPWALVMFGDDKPMTAISGYSAAATQLLGHDAATGVSGCEVFQWYSVTRCSGNPSYATSYFL